MKITTHTNYAIMPKTKSTTTTKSKNKFVSERTLPANDFRGEERRSEPLARISV